MVNPWWFDGGMCGETNHHASTIGVNVNYIARFVKFDLAKIVLFFAEGKTRNLFEVGCLANVSRPSNIRGKEYYSTSINNKKDNSNGNKQ